MSMSRKYRCGCSADTWKRISTLWLCTFCILAKFFPVLGMRRQRSQRATQLHSPVSPPANQANVGAAVLKPSSCDSALRPRANFLSLAAQQQQSGGWEGAGPLHPSPGSLTAPRHRAARLTVHARHQAHHHLHRR